MTPGKVPLVAASSLVGGSVSCSVLNWMIPLELIRSDAEDTEIPPSEVEEERWQLQYSSPLQLVIEL